MTIFLRTLHRRLCKEFGSSNIGKLSQMHPMVQRIFNECSPHMYENGKYKKFAAVICDWDKDITPENVWDIVPPVIFANHMYSFAVGIQYAAKKLGLPVEIDDYQFEHTLHGIEGGRYGEFLAAAGPTTDGEQHIVINPVGIYFAELKPNRNEKILEMIGYKGFTQQEFEIITGAEEFLHLYQRQHQNLRPTYSISNFDSKAYKNDKMEIDANAFKQVAIQELGLGPQFRGRRK